MSALYVAIADLCFMTGFWSKARGDTSLYHLISSYLSNYNRFIFNVSVPRLNPCLPSKSLNCDAVDTDYTVLFESEDVK